MPIVRNRAIFLFAFLTAWAIVVVGRLVQIQIVRHEHYETRAARQHESTLTLTPERGSILDARGRILAESIGAVSIYADPQGVTDPEATARKLAAIPELGLVRRDLERRLRGHGEFAWVARQLSPEIAEKVRALKLDGVYELSEHRRSYPKGSLASNVLGYVNVDGEGLAGVEHSYERFVRGRSGKVTLLRDARRGRYMVSGQGSAASVDGRDVVLTIDEVIQFATETALGKAMSETQALGGVAIVMDPNDGAILAMASSPDFDPNRFRSFGPGAWRNRAIQDLYEPGSTFKIVMAVGGLEEGIVTPSQVVNCGPGYIEVGRHRIREHDGNVYGSIPFEEVLVHSSNVGSVRVALDLGPARFHRYISTLGFGDRTGIDLPGEAAGIVRPTKRWSQLSNASMAIGQEIAATPLQILVAAASVANGGKLVRPHVVDRVIDENGSIRYRPLQKEPARIYSDRTAAVLNEMLKAVVSRGTGVNAALSRHVVAGKTGTAQKSGRGGYAGNHHVASFVGYVPADRPRLAIIVVLDEPRGKYYGGQVAAPAFREIAETTLRYLGVPSAIPDREISTPMIASLPPITGGVPELPHAPQGVVPDLRGLDARTAITRALASGFTVKAGGGGYVVGQTPEPGTVTKEGALSLQMLTPLAGDSR